MLQSCLYLSGQVFQVYNVNLQSLAVMGDCHNMSNGEVIEHAVDEFRDALIKRAKEIKKLRKGEITI